MMTPALPHVFNARPSVFLALGPDSVSPCSAYRERGISYEVRSTQVVLLLLR